MAVPRKPYDPYRPTATNRLRRWWGSFPLWMRAAAIVSVLLMATAAGGAAIYKQGRSQKAAAVMAGWERFEKAAKEGNEDELFAALDAVTSADPNDTRAVEYRRALDTGEGSAADGALNTLLLVRHLRANDMPAAAREAKKRLEREPNDWLARCAVVAAAMTAGDLPAARAELAALPNPTDHPPSAFALLFAYDLCTRAGVDAAKLRRFVNDSVTHVFGSVAVDRYPPPVLVQLIRCYLIAFDLPPGEALGQRLAAASHPITRITERALNEAIAGGDVALLTQLGGACDRLAGAFERLRQDDQISEAQLVGLSSEHEPRVERVWREVLARAPNEPTAYLGLSRWHARAGRRAEARAMAADGLKACGDHVPLLAQYSSLLLRDANASEAADVTRAAAEREPNNVIRWLLAAEAAVAVPRRDLALDACRRARALVPNHPRAVWLEAQLLLDSGDANGAVQLLRQFGDAVILSNPPLARAYSRGLAAAGLGLTAPDLLVRAEAAAGKAGNPAVAAAVIDGLADTAYDPALSAAMQKTADRLSDRWPADHAVLTARAAALRQAAAEGEPLWDPIRLRAAAAALERVRVIRPDDLDIVAELTWVKLKGEAAADRAARTAEPLAAAFDKSAPLTGRQLTVLGALWAATAKTERALTALQQAERVGPPTATTPVELARVYLALGRTADARASLATARTRRMTPQDLADHAAISAALPREKP